MGAKPLAPRATTYAVSTIPSSAAVIGMPSFSSTSFSSSRIMGSAAEFMWITKMEAGAPGEYTYTRKGEILRCAWHGWEFDVRTGQSWCDPTRVRVRSYNVSVETGDAMTREKGPYVAETYTVSVEERYVIVEIP